MISPTIFFVISTGFRNLLLSLFFPYPNYPLSLDPEPYSFFFPLVISSVRNKVWLSPTEMSMTFNVWKKFNNVNWLRLVLSPVGILPLLL